MLPPTSAFPLRLASEGWKPWDYAAGSLFVEEAGGCMSDLRTGLFDLYGSEVLAAASESLCGESSKTEH